MRWTRPSGSNLSCKRDRGPVPKLLHPDPAGDGNGYRLAGRVTGAGNVICGLTPGRSKGQMASHAKVTAAAPARRTSSRGTRAVGLLFVFVLVLVLVLALCACSSFKPEGRPVAEIDEPRYLAPSSTRAPQVALVLSGGSARGFAHLGVLRVLEREGLRPDLVVGTSAGAIAGGLYASGMSIDEIEALAVQLDWFTVFDVDPVHSLLGGVGLGLARGRRLETLLRKSLGVSIQAFPMAFAAVATDLNSGQTVVLNHGDAALAMRASSAVPGMLEPVKVGGRLLADGQIVSPLPIAVARQLGARVVIAVDLVFPPKDSAMSNPVSVLFQTVLISSYRHLLNERPLADLVLSPKIETTGQLGFGDRDWLIKSGAAAAEAALPQLRAAFAVKRSPDSRREPALE